ncbi:MAG: insulinase family protein [Bryobacteraceae bacterium]|nr:insulinase family protein [Bryobacteraceae bacterium]
MRYLLLLTLVIAADAQVKLPPYTKHALPNGATLILMPRAELPLTTVTAVFRGGAEAESISGLASVTAELLDRGTPTKSAEQLALAFDSLGATLDTRASDHQVTVATEFLSRDTDRALPLLAELVRQPVFPADEVKKVLAQFLDAARSVKDNPQAAAGLAYRRFFYGASHPYGRPVRGDETSLPKITRESIVAYQQRMLVARNLTVIAIGNFATADLLPKLTSAFSSLPAGDAYQPIADPGLKRGAKPRLLLIDKPDATQTYFFIGQPGIQRGHPDQVPLQLVNTLFGGRFTSMLNDELRVNTGLTYGANCQLSLNRLTGSITISSFTKTETTERTIDLALGLLKKLSTSGLTPDGLKSAKAYTKGLFPSDRLETNEQLTQVLAEIEQYGLNRGEVDDLFSKIDAVTPERANAAARTYYRQDGLVFVLLGNAAKIRDIAKKYAAEMTELPLARLGLEP